MAAVKDTARGSRLPDDWEPSESVKDDLRSQYPNLKLGEILLEFRDYWPSIPGQRGRRVDWDRTFRNRVREVSDKPRYQRNGEKLNAVDQKAMGWQMSKQVEETRLELE